MKGGLLVYSIQGVVYRLERGGEGASSGNGMKNHRRMEMTFESSACVSVRFNVLRMHRPPLVKETMCGPAGG